MSPTRRLAVIARTVRQEASDPSWWVDVALRFLVRTALVRPYFRYVRDVEGTAVMDEDWDNLLILDALRYDLADELGPVDGRLEKRTSKGSMTAEFLVENFGDGTFEDTVYVTANPTVDVYLDDPFHRTVSVWRDHWDDEHGTVMPADMVAATKAAHDRYPDKRLVSHFVQPHIPFVGEFGRELADDAGDAGDAGVELGKRVAEGEAPAVETTDVWDLLKRDEVDEDAVWRAYRENVRVTAPHVAELVESLPGKSVVTSDHGNLVGERPHPCPVPVRLYGHPAGIHAEKLVEVPWLVVEGDERKSVSAGPTREAATGAPERTDDDVAADRLRDLGYRT